MNFLKRIFAQDTEAHADAPSKDGFLLSQERVDALRAAMNAANICDPINLEVLGDLSMEEREEFAFRTGTLALYVGSEEVGELQASEEQAALKAMPKGYGLDQLNGINVGCGGRIVDEQITPIDIMRCPMGASGEHAEHTPRALLALPDALPFRENSLDFIIALHMLEHVGNPHEVIRYFLSLLKPGGGIGIVVPDWRYTWDARHDVAEFGHKWNCTPALVQSLYDEHWADLCDLEALDTYRHKMSFDFVLRKHGDFTPFDVTKAPRQKSGKELSDEGAFLHGE
ncbi:methyltransferase domain-containing protein [Kordiimonas sp. SCSIO 12610]|uniref:methyltransferase domain-containing protein n=1 Tax=Kordiimonas sp. SCSIO 12610 TaxID=2829597 RepID=UPI00210D42B9|nr:methyltransferase domain-containing protein [Kordiimonas sp. SCSIO 12610]UTW56165.1 methyltransferase domain-containing protein [Kordiimonas sp. SCSIO 12610]